MAGRVKRARREKKLSARALDRLAELCPGHTNLIETGRRLRLEAITIVKLADTLGVTLDWLIRGGPGPAPTNPAELSPKPRRKYTRKPVALTPNAVPPEMTGTDDE